ncbi:hypothetical protein [Puniceicoccus vermicola]|uniref:ECF transporter S component n=1 Tax=Puniceicoccus vermicola TaxID=388746 RepID=A0A7X1AYU0_9BACT|nr:hypothetical protein [Puniceicoccus vermicola]MBC2601438.1 hypothetical protein [Puniceicoccus vermicola]
MKLLRQALVALLTNLLVLFLVLELNSSISPLGIYLTIGGILVVYPAFSLSPVAGMPVVLITGFMWGATLPLPLGVLPFALGVIYAGLFRMRNRFRSRRTFHLATVATGSNLLLLIFLGIWFFPSSGWSPYLIRFLLETLLSEAAVFLLSFWIFDLQERCVDLLGAQPTPDEMT